MTTPSFHSPSDVRAQPRQFLDHLFQAAVARALPLADGSDHGGSLRNPAAYNNVYGLRPSQGLVPGGHKKELFLSQMGVGGPMARNVRDLALLLDVQDGIATITLQLE